MKISIQDRYMFSNFIGNQIKKEESGDNFLFH